MMALALGEHAPPGTDLGRVTAMLLVHDLVEIDAGDLFAYADAARQARQEEAERAAADRIFALLPPDQAGRLRGLWDEFEERRTPEARFARGLDRLQPMLANMRPAAGPGRNTGSPPTRSWQGGADRGRVPDPRALCQGPGRPSRTDRPAGPRPR